MLDIGWPELLIVALVTIIVVGPKELPRVLRTVTQMVRKVRSMASEFQSSIDDLAREAELDDLKKDIEKVASTDIAGELEHEIDPTGEVNKSVREIEESLKEEPRMTSRAARSSRPDDEKSTAEAAALEQERPDDDSGGGAARPSHPDKAESSEVAAALGKERPEDDRAGDAAPTAGKKKAGGRA